MLSWIQLFCDPWTAACQAPLSMGFSRSPGKNTGVGCHFLLQETFLTQGLKPCLLHWQADSLALSHLGFQAYNILNKIMTWFEREVCKQYSFCPRTVLIYSCCPSILKSFPFCSQISLHLDNKLLCFPNIWPMLTQENTGHKVPPIPPPWHENSLTIMTNLTQVIPLVLYFLGFVRDENIQSLASGIESLINLLRTLKTLVENLPEKEDRKVQTLNCILSSFVFLNHFCTYDVFDSYNTLLK